MRSFFFKYMFYTFCSCYTSIGFGGLGGGTLFYVFLTQRLRLMELPSPANCQWQQRGMDLKCFFLDELLLVFIDHMTMLNWKRVGNYPPPPSPHVERKQVPIGEERRPTDLRACLPKELPSQLIHLPSLNTVLSPLLSQSTTNTRLFCMSDF